MRKNLLHRGFTVILAICALYLFFTGHIDAFPEESVATVSIPIEEAFRILDAENVKVRKLWTKQIVGAGKEVGLKFSEDWRDEDVYAGPLPALFLREIAGFLSDHDVPLNLYLGSEFPINDANAFGGQQQDMFDILEVVHEPQFFYASDTDRHLAMFEDVAQAEACVTCHNEHPQTPKADWLLGDVMGATTWSYPSEAVSPEELMQMILALREGFAYAYAEYVAELETFDSPPDLGESWPQQGFFVPTTEAFMNEVSMLVSADTLTAILDATERAPEQQSVVMSNPSGR